MENICAICKAPVKDGEYVVTLTEKGSSGVNNASKVRGDVDTVNTYTGDKVHKVCRRQYCNKNVIQRDTSASLASSTDSYSQQRSLRSKDDEQLQFCQMCIFCGKPAMVTNKKRKNDVYPVRTMGFQTSLAQVITDREEDDWALEVRARLEFVRDLPAADAVYHQQCNVNFRTNKQIPKQFTNETNKRRKSLGRPVNDLHEAGFQRIIDFLNEHADDQITIPVLVDHMKSFCGDEAYSATHMKNRLLKHFGSDIIITELNGKPNVITFKAAASSILSDFQQRPKDQDIASEKRCIIETAAKLLKSDIKTIDNSKDVYPAAYDIASSEENIKYIPNSLQILLRSLFKEADANVKLASIGQAIVQAARPRALITPLQLGLGIQMHHQFGSKFLIDTLHQLGFCVSYSEVQKFETSAAASQGTDIDGITQDHTIQYVADNVDHNLRTLDGHNTFHGMGIIACVTPAVSRQRPIPRLSVSMEEVTALARINIDFCRLHSNPLEKFMFGKISAVPKNDPTWKLDLLSKVAWTVRSHTGWSAMMQTVQDGEFPGKSSVVFLPMIDLDPSDLSCIYSTLNFVSKEACRHGSHPIITFDQPLYWKALMIILNEHSSSILRSIVLRLGGFHMEMSFLGCIGHLMNGSGLQELLETVYAPSAVTHMLSGKAVARAVRGHFLVDAALNAIMLSTVFQCPLPNHHCEDDTVLSLECDTHRHSDTSMDTDDTSAFTEGDPTTELHRSSVTSSNVADNDNNPINNGDLIEAAELYDRLMDKDLSTREACEEKVLDRIQHVLDAHKTTLGALRTAGLWMQYMDMIDILRQFIKAERTGDWALHLQMVEEMLPFFAASGHNLYTKSAYVYLQTMQALDREHPLIHAAFQTGHHVIRRSDRYWAGLSTDLIIEQVLMRSVKTAGGLTRGRGMSEGQRAQWLLSMPSCAEMNRSMQEFTDVNFHTSEQHKESGKARRERDTKDALTFLNFLEDRNPFREDANLRNIETGETANDKVNADKALEVGKKILQSMEGQNVAEYVFKRSNQVVALSSKSTIKVDGEAIHVDPQLLFQRLIAAANGLEIDAPHIFTYELSNHPSSMFDTSGLPRPAQKPALADAIWGLGDCSSAPPQSHDVHFVLDGGSLLHRIPWTRGSLFSEICEKYVDYVLKHYHQPTIVFDGYSAGPSTKDITHIRRTGGAVGAKVTFTENMPFRTKKELFLANSENKQNFLNMLSEKLDNNGCRTVHATDDADTLIVQTAVEISFDTVTVLIGEDTDLLVLLLFHAELNAHDIFFQSVQSGCRKNKVWDILKTKKLLGPRTCYFLPFVHAITGCDTTSRIFGIGKGTALKKVRNDTCFQEMASVFCRNSTQEDVLVAGEKAIVALYNGDKSDGLDTLRYKKFSSKVMFSTTCVQVHTLPPTAAAAGYHSMRVYLQVQQWMRPSECLLPEDWVGT